MKRYTILVTAVGAVVGYGIINSLKHSGFNPYIIGCDIFEDAVGQHFANEFVTACPAADNNYCDFLKSLIDEKEIDMVLFGIEQEIAAVYSNAEAFRGYEDKLIINRREIIPLCDDKWLTNIFLAENNLERYAIDSTIGKDFLEVSERFGLPFLIKPRRSRAGKGIVEISSEDEFYFYRNTLGDNFMAQRIVGDIDQEYTVSVFGLGDGSYINSIYMRRTLSGEGATVKAWVVDDIDLERATLEITRILKPVGPTNYQFRKEDDNVFLLEINPRISSSTSIRSSFGYNEAKMCIEYYLNKTIPTEVKIKKGRAIRYISDMVFDV